MNSRAVILSVYKALSTTAAILILTSAADLIKAGDQFNGSLLCAVGIIILFLVYFVDYDERPEGGDEDHERG
jgi:hypothetical protein